MHILLYKSIQITISCGFTQEIEMPDDTKVKRVEEIVFCVKQFFISEIPTLDEGEHLYDKHDISYLVSFKRLQGTFDVYAKIVKKFMEHFEVSPAIKFQDMIGNHNKSTSDNNEDDEKSDDKQ